MRGIGKRLRRAADGLGLSDSEVARRLGLSQSRYHNYVAETSEPDLDMVTRICGVLAITPNDLLSPGEPIGEVAPDDVFRARIRSASAALRDDALAYAADIVEAMVEAQRRRLAPVSERRGGVAPRRAGSRSPKDA